MQSTEQYTLELVAIGLAIGVATLVLGILIYSKIHAVERKHDDVHYGLFEVLKIIRRWVHFLVADKITGKVEEIRKEAGDLKGPEDTQ